MLSVLKLRALVQAITQLIISFEAAKIAKPVAQAVEQAA